MQSSEQSHRARCGKNTRGFCISLVRLHDTVSNIRPNVTEGSTDRAARRRPMLHARPTYPQDFYVPYLILNHPANIFFPKSPCSHFPMPAVFPFPLPFHSPHTAFLHVLESMGWHFIFFLKTRYADGRFCGKLYLFPGTWHACHWKPPIVWSNGSVERSGCLIFFYADAPLPCYTVLVDRAFSRFSPFRPFSYFLTRTNTVSSVLLPRYGVCVFLALSFPVL